MIQEIQVKTHQAQEFIDITSEVQSALEKTGIREGFCVVSALHTTVGIWVNEREADLHSDVMRVLDRLVPVRGEYRHSDGNAHAHIKSSLMGVSKPFIVNDGRLVLGTWQSIFLSEFDGPRTRKVVVKVMEG